MRFERRWYGLAVGVVMLWVVPCLCEAQTEAGTTAIVIWTPKDIVVAADGKVTRKGDPGLRFFEQCKIRRAGSYYFTAAGLYTYGRFGFNLWETLRASAERADSIQAAARIAEEGLYSGLKIVLDHMTQSEREQLECEQNDIYFSFAFAGIDDGQLVVSAREFTRDTDGSIKVDSWECPCEQSAILRMGEGAAIEREFLPVLKKLPKDHPGFDPISLARSMVDFEIALEPEKVGPPVSVLRIGLDSTTWEEAGACEESD